MNFEPTKIFLSSRFSEEKNGYDYVNIVSGHAPHLLASLHTAMYQHPVIRDIIDASLHLIRFYELMKFDAESVLSTENYFFEISGQPLGKNNTHIGVHIEVQGELPDILNALCFSMLMEPGFKEILQTALKSFPAFKKNAPGKIISHCEN